MKNILLLSFMILSFQMIYAQCNYVTNGKDEFTGKIVQETKPKILRTHGMLMFGELLAFKRSDSSFYVILTSMDASPKTVGTSDAFIMKLSDSTIITIYPLDIYSSSPHTSESGTNWILDAIYKISAADLRKLSVKKIVKYRIYYNQNYSDDDVKDNRASDITDLVKCVLE